MNLEWIPLKSVGPFKFNTNINEYIDKYDLVTITQDFEVTGSHKPTLYALEKYDIFIYVDDNNLIEDIHCYEFLMYRDVNLINKSIEEAKKILNTREDLIDTQDLEDYVETIYYFDDYDMELRTKEDIVNCVMCGPELPDE